MEGNTRNEEWVLTNTRTPEEGIMVIVVVNQLPDPTVATLYDGKWQLDEVELQDLEITNEDILAWHYMPHIPRNLLTT